METNLCFQGIQFDLETACIFSLVFFFPLVITLALLKNRCRVSHLNILSILNLIERKKPAIVCVSSFIVVLSLSTSAF